MSAAPLDVLDHVREYVTAQVAAAESGQFEGEPFQRDPVEADRIRPVAACAKVLAGLSPLCNFESHAWRAGSDGTEALCDPDLEITEFSAVLSWQQQKVGVSVLDMPSPLSPPCAILTERPINTTIPPPQGAL